VVPSNRQSKNVIQEGEGKGGNVRKKGGNAPASLKKTTGGEGHELFQCRNCSFMSFRPNRPHKRKGGEGWHWETVLVPLECDCHALGGKGEGKGSWQGKGGRQYSVGISVSSSSRGKKKKGGWMRPRKGTNGHRRPTTNQLPSENLRRRRGEKGAPMPRKGRGAFLSILTPSKIVFSRPRGGERGEKTPSVPVGLVSPPALEERKERRRKSGRCFFDYFCLCGPTTFCPQ